MTVMYFKQFPSAVMLAEKTTKSTHVRKLTFFFYFSKPAILTKTELKTY